MTESGLFEKARQAEQKSENAQIQEEAILADYENKIGEYVEGSRDTVTVDKAEYEQLKKDVETLKNMNTNFQSDNGTITISNTNLDTLKTFTNLEPGLYFVSYTQAMTIGYTGFSLIFLNDTIIASDYGVANNFGSPTACSSGIVNVTSKDDVITLCYGCNGVSSTNDRSYSWQLLKLK